MKKNQTLTGRIRAFLLVLLACTMAGNVQARKTNDSSPSPRQQWADLCYRIARPVLENMSRGELQKNMQLELSPTWDGRRQAGGLHGNLWPPNGRHLPMALATRR